MNFVIAVGRPFFVAHHPRDFDGRFLRGFRPREHLFVDVGFSHDALDEAGTVSNVDELNFAGASAVEEPSLQSDFLADVLANAVILTVGSRSMWKSWFSSQWKTL